jgi:hypothetical protein
MRRSLPLLAALAAFILEMLRCPVLVLPHGVALRFAPNS